MLWTEASKHAGTAFDVLHTSSRGMLWAERTLQTPERRRLVELILQALLAQFWHKIKHPLTSEAPTMAQRYFIVQLRASLEASEVLLIEQRLQKFEVELTEIDIASLMDDCCAICHDGFGDDTEIGFKSSAIKIPCNYGHIFHRRCILIWLYHNHFSCPADRDKLTPEQTELVFDDCLPGATESQVCTFIARELGRMEQRCAATRPQRMVTFLRPGGFWDELTGGTVEDQADAPFPTHPTAQNHETFHETRIEREIVRRRDRDEQQLETAEALNFEAISDDINELTEALEEFLFEDADDRGELESEGRGLIRDENLQLSWEELVREARGDEVIESIEQRLGELVQVS